MVVRVRAPLRISFAGGGTDVAPFPQTEGGAVLSATIDRFVHGTLRPRPDDRVVVTSPGDLDFASAAMKRLGLGGYHVDLRCAVPPGSGLGSSSATTVALVGAVREYFGLAWSAGDVARLAFQIERDDLGIAGGTQDHYAAAFGGFNFIEFGSDVVVHPLSVPPSVVDRLAAGLLLCFTGVTRESARIIRDQTARVRGRQDRTLAGLRAQKSLAVRMRTALLDGDLDCFGELLGAAWAQKKKFSPLITTPRIDEIYDLALRAGARGGKVTGAGGGGHLLFYCDPAGREKVRAALTRFGATVTGIGFDRAGLTTWQA
jgi:D-glycero-alpha-D-manno-heptose-7-phosphate kinase